MTYRLEKLPGQPIVQWTIHEGFRLSDDLPAFISDARHMLENGTEDVYYLADARKLNAGFTDLLFALATLALGEMAILKHPRIIQIVGVGQGFLIEMAIKALGQAQYGSLPVSFHHTLEGALEHIQHAVNTAQAAA